MDWFTLSVITAVLWGVVPYFEKQAVMLCSDAYAAVAVRSMGAAVGILLPLMMPATRTALVAMPGKAFLFLILVGVVGSVLGQITYLGAMRLGEVSRVAPVAAAWPVISVFVALLFLGEPISLKKILALTLVIGGVALLKL